MKTINKHTTYLEEAKVNVARAITEYRSKVCLGNVIALEQSLDHLHKLLIAEKWLKEHTEEELSNLRKGDL